MKPFVGLPSTATDETCAYSADIDQPFCGQPASIHVIGRSDSWGWVSLSTCEAHLPIATAGCAEVADVHPAAGCSGEHYAPAAPLEDR